MHAREREPSVAGRFYPAAPRELAQLVRGLMSEPVASPIAARMLMAPHAGYVYSGAIAAATFARVDVPPTAVVLCPNHTGRGDRRAVYASGSWAFPGFELAVDEELAARLVEHAGFRADILAHAREHAAEVQMPFLHERRTDVRVVPVCLAGLSLEDCRVLGAGLANVVREVERERRERILLVASSDMSHYVPADVARHYDMHALERLLALDPEGLFGVVEREDISMCGYVPTTVALFAARALGAEHAELVRYGSSGDVSGDPSSVVGYAGVVVH